MIVFPKCHETNVSLLDGTLFIEQQRPDFESVFVEIPVEYANALCRAIQEAKSAFDGGDR